VNAQYGQDRFKKFDQHALKVLEIAHQEAEHRGHHYIGTEHLLLGVINEKDGEGAQILERLGVSAEQVSKNVELLLSSQRADYATSNGVLQWLKGVVRFQRHKRRGWDAVGLTARAKKSLELAVDEAGRLHHQQVGTEQLLFGLVSEGHGLAVRVLSELGVSQKAVYDALRQLG
jgi:ATP-dependent Clp protease ATP-binding subunit ClpC